MSDHDAGGTGHEESSGEGEGCGFGGESASETVRHGGGESVICGVEATWPCRGICQG